MTVTHVSPYGAWHHAYSSTPVTRTPSYRAASVISRCAPFGQDSSVVGIPRHAASLHEACHCQMVDHHARQRPAHRRRLELGARLGHLAHILAPHLSTLLVPVAAHTHMRDCGAPPVGLVRQAHDHRVTRNALAPAASTPSILTSNTARQHCMVWFNALTRHLQPQAIQARERAQIRAMTDSTGHVEVFQMDGVAISNIERPRPYPATTHPTPPTTPTPSNAKNP